MTSERDYPRRIDNGSTRTEIVLTGVAASDEAQPGMVWWPTVLRREERHDVGRVWCTHITLVIMLPADPMLNADVTYPAPHAAGPADVVAQHIDPEAVARCPSLHCDRPIKRLESGAYFCPACSWHGKDPRHPAPPPLFAKGDHVRFRDGAAQVMNVRRALYAGTTHRYDVAMTGRDEAPRMGVEEGVLVASERPR